MCTLVHDSLYHLGKGIASYLILDLLLHMEQYFSIVDLNWSGETIVDRVVLRCGVGMVISIEAIQLPPAMRSHHIRHRTTFLVVVFLSVSF